MIDNRPGASGIIGTELVAKSAPDGYTLLIGITGTLAINPAMFPKLPYDSIRDFAPISLAAVGPNILVVHPSLPVRSVKELIVFCKQHPGKLSYASSGTGGAPHLAGELFKSMAGVNLVHVPYDIAALISRFGPPHGPGDLIPACGPRRFGKTAKEEMHHGESFKSSC